MKRKILLVGGAGFIGHNLAILLKKKNQNVIVADNLNINSLNYIKKEIKDKNKYAGKLINCENEKIELLIEKKGSNITFDFKNIKDANLVYEF